MMNWLPEPQEFRSKLHDALAIADHEQRLTRLALLAQHRLSFLETVQLDRGLRETSVDSPAGYLRIRLAILSSSTVDHLLPGIRVAGLRRRILFDVHIGSYGQYRQDLMNADSPLYRFAPQAVLFSISAREMIAGIPVTSASRDAEERLARTVYQQRLLWRKVTEVFSAIVIQQTFIDVTDSVFGSYDRLVGASPARLVARLNDLVSEAADADKVLLLDVARAAARDGRDAWFSCARWLQAKQEIAPQAVSTYGELLTRVVAAQFGLSRKCLVLDLDNTLWHGVIGDDGLDGIILGAGTAAGEAHVALQHYVKQLRARGIILAVCSKNDPQIAAEAFDKHPEMILQKSDFAAFVANWNDKAANIQSIARQLNIGLDSLVFVDDNPVERARIRQALPMVAVPELPDDAADYVSCLSDAGYFEAVSFTSDDRQRADQYTANAARQAMREASVGIEEFLEDMEMSLNYGPISSVDLARVTQLINKTNQFTPTTRRYLLEEVARFAAVPENVTLQFRLSDKFGDNGLVSTMILLRDPADTSILVLDTWVMSCRVFGRELEFEAMNIAVEIARRNGVRGIQADYIPTAKNAAIST